MEERTTQQNRALHLYLSRLAEIFRERGIERKVVGELLDKATVPWNTASLKEIWRIIQMEVILKESTTELAKQKDIDEVRLVLERDILTPLGIEPINFPGNENEEYNKI